MPYLAMRPNGDRVISLDVDGSDEILCPLCEGPLFLRRSHYNSGRFVSKHFVHHPGSECSGESNLHAKLKTIAAMKLREVFESATVDHEQSIRPEQGRVLEVAAQNGYYETPRETTLDELAAELDCPRSTVSYRLRKAEAALVEAYLSTT